MHGKTENFYGGKCKEVGKAKVFREPENPWYVAEEMYKEDYYPPYALGGGYVLSADVNSCALQAMTEHHANNTMLFPVEDAFVGILIQKGGCGQCTDLGNKKFATSTSFKKPRKPRKLHPERISGRYVQHGVKQTDSMIRIHQYACCDTKSIHDDFFMVRDSISCNNTVVCPDSLD